MSIDSSFITRRKSVYAPTNTDKKYSGIIKAASQLNGLGKNIILAGSRSSGKSSFAKNLSDKNSSIARVLLDFRISSAKGAQLPDVCFQATDDERIPREALVISLSAAKPTRALLDDSNRFFCRIIFDLARFCAVNSTNIGDTKQETLAKSVSKSTEYYIASCADNPLAQWLDATDHKLFLALEDELFQVISDGDFAAAAKMIYRQSETERTFRLNSSSMSFELFCKFCDNDSVLQRAFDRLWGAFIPSLWEKFLIFCRDIAQADGCFFSDDGDTARLTLISDFLDNAKYFFANHPTAQHIYSRLFFSSASKNGNALVPENYFSNVRYTFRMDSEILQRLSEKGIIGKLEVLKSDGKIVHAINLIEIGRNHAESPESAIKLYSAAGLIVFGANDEFSSRAELFDNVSHFIREGVARFPVVLVRSKRDQDVLCSLAAKSTAGSDIICYSENDYRVDALLAGKHESESYYYPFFNEFKKNHNKTRPIICGVFSSALYPNPESGLAKDMLNVYEKAEIRDANSAEYIVDVLKCILDETKSRRLFVNSAALTANFTEFSGSSITITPNVFSTLCSAYCASASDSKGEQSFLSSWLVFGEKYDNDFIGNAFDATFVNSLRSVYRTYLKKTILISSDIAENVTDSPDTLIKLLDNALQTEFGGTFARIVGEYCFKKIEAENISPKARFHSMINIISNELFPDDEVTITRDNILGKLISLALNDCVYTAIRRNCCVEY